MKDKGTSDGIIRNVALIKAIIFSKCEKLESTTKRNSYLKKVINDCKRIISLAKTFDDGYLDVNVIVKREKNIDEYLIMFLDKLCVLPMKPANYKSERQFKKPYLVRQPRKYYLVSPTDGGRVCDIQSAIEGMKNIKESLEDHIAVIEAVDKKAGNPSVPEIERIMIKSGLSDVVRIFEAMKEAGIISLKTEVKQFAELFFSEVTDKSSFERKYNATKSRMKKEESSSNSKELFEFVTGLISTSYKGKGAEIERIIKRLEEMQKNII